MATPTEQRLWLPALPPTPKTIMSDHTVHELDSDADATPIRQGQMSSNGHWVFGSIFAVLVLIGFGFGVWAGAAKPKPKVFDNDNLPKEDKLSVVGQQPVAEAKPSTTEEGNDKAATPDGKAPDGKAVVTPKPDPVNPATATEDEKAKKQAELKDWQAKIGAQKEQVSMASRELDVTQREYQLRAAAMYADVGNRLRNAVQWDKEEASYKQQLVDKQKALDDAKQKVEELKDAALKAGVPSSMIE